MPSAIVFDLDETLLDTSPIREAREARAWRRVADRFGDVRPYEIDGSTVQVADLPRRLREQGYPVGVLTHSPRWYAIELLDIFGIGYDELITGSDSYPPKPDPTSLRAIADQLGATPDEVLFVGDAGTDFGAAAAAGATSVGVCWSREAPESWHRQWPDVAITRPERLFKVLTDEARMSPLAEVLADGLTVCWHWGSVIQLDTRVYAIGRYFSTADMRHSTHRLSQLTLDAKESPDAAEEMARIFSTFAARAAGQGRSFDIVTSVPPRPDSEYDRFAVPRERVAAVFGARAAEDVLSMRYPVEDYKSLDHAARAEVNADRFVARDLKGARVLILEDVLTSGSGGQAQTCAAKLLDGGSAGVTVLGMCATQDALPRACPRCGGLLRVKNGRYGRFIGCSNWHHLNCDYSEDLPAAQ